jgi:hypothetical protein
MLANSHMHCKFSSMRQLILAPLLAMICTIAHADVSRSATQAVYPNVQYEDFKLQRKDFNFFSYKAWVKRGGEWHVEGPVSHKGLLCGTYELGMSFGVGKMAAPTSNGSPPTVT